MALCPGCGDKKPGTEPGGGGIEKFDPVPVEKTNSMNLWVYYMPWFDTPETTEGGTWGWHWTMTNRNPETIDGNGHRQIASHYYPLIGPYASRDADVIEYHLLLMKYAGVDGILIDWYGTRDVLDYPTNRINTEAIVEGCEKVGMKFAIVYEDQTVNANEPSHDEKIDFARADMTWLQSNFFKSPEHIKIDGRPLLMTFGPQALIEPTDWMRVFSTLNPKPVFLPLYAHSRLAGENAQGEYIWVDGTSLDTKYEAVKKLDVWMGGAWPGFHDYYVEGGAGQRLLDGVVDHPNATLLEELMARAKTEGAEHLQLITWNDFGEGTMIEPTEELGYTLLNKVQEFSGVSYRTDVLESIYDYYNLKKELAGDREAEQQLLQAFYYFISAQEDKAREIIEVL
jgi:hypothetical protein